MTLYRDILRKSLLATWRHKYLWFFGVFIALLGGGGELDVLYRNPYTTIGENFSPVITGLFKSGIFSPQTFSSLLNMFKTDPLSAGRLSLLVLMFMALLVFLIWLMVVSEVAAVKAASDIYEGKEGELTIKKGVFAGVEKFWPALGLNVINQMLIALSFTAIGLPFVYYAGANKPLLIGSAYVALFIVFIPLMIIASFILKYATAFVVLKKNGFFEAVKNGFSLFSANWLVSVEMAFILFFVTIFLFLFFLVVTSLVVTPIMFMSISLYNSFLSYSGFWLIFAFSLIFIVISLLAVISLTSIFRVLSWTMLFKELVLGRATSKLLRLFNKA